MNGWREAKPLKEHETKHRTLLGWEFKIERTTGVGMWAYNKGRQKYNGIRKLVKLKMPGTTVNIFQKYFIMSLLTTESMIIMKISFYKKINLL